MSRHPSLKGDTHISIEGVKAICSKSLQDPLITSVALSSVDVMEATEVEGQTMSQIDIWQIRKAQKEDPVISVWTTAVKDKKCL